MNIVRGDTGAFKFQRLNSGGEPITSIPDEMFFTVKKSFSFNAYVLQKKLSDMMLGEDNCWHFTIEPSDTATLDYGTYVYDIEVTTGEYVQTIAKGKLVIEEESTWESNK